VLLSAALALAGCGAADAGSPAGGASPTGVATSAPDRQVAPIQAELHDLLGQVKTVQARAVRACMERKGFTVHPVDNGSDAPPPGDGYPFRDPLTPAQAQANGYPGIGETNAGPEPSTQPTDDPFSRLPQDEQNRYHDAVGRKARFVLPNGEVTALLRGGCEEEVLVAIHGDLAKFLMLHYTTANAPNEVREQTEADHRVADALRRWSQCMRERGYPDLGTLDDATVLATAYYWPRGQPPPRQEDARPKEIALAVADATCLAQFDVDTVHRDVWLETRQAYYRKHETDFVALRDQLKAALVRAQQLVRGG
jgi:hypothetical protein